jgi:hypothetical protein
MSLKGRAIERAFAQGENVITCGEPREDRTTFFSDPKPPGYWKMVEWLSEEAEETAIREDAERESQWAAWLETPAGKRFAEKERAKERADEY